MLLNCGIGEDSWESLGLQGDPTSPSWSKSVLNIHWKDWCWSWNSNTLNTWCEELTHLRRLWCWERLKTGRKGNDRGWDGWMVSLTWWAWAWANSGSWWWTGEPGMIQSMWLQRAGHFWMTEQNWTSRDESSLVPPSFPTFSIFLVSYSSLFVIVWLGARFWKCQLIFKIL